MFRTSRGFAWSDSRDTPLLPVTFIAIEDCVGARPVGVDIAFLKRCTRTERHTASGTARRRSRTLTGHLRRVSTWSMVASSALPSAAASSKRCATRALSRPGGTTARRVHPRTRAVDRPAALDLKALSRRTAVPAPQPIMPRSGSFKSASAMPWH